MGVQGLWKLIENAATHESLTMLTVREGFEGKRRDRLYRIGVDVSIWVQQLQQKFCKGHAQAGENPELRTFFYRLAMLAERPIHLIFVTDGPHRPQVKRGTQVKSTPNWMVDGMERIVHAFGFAWLIAAGEAEAELARMNELGVIDAVMTDDSDTLVFGGCVVIRNPSFKRTQKDTVAVYRASQILRKTGLSKADMVLLALLKGCDYDQRGLSGCGLRVAHGLAKYGLAESLYHALTTHTTEELRAFLLTWRTQLKQKLCKDPAGWLGRSYPSVANAVTDTFPDVGVARLLVRPALLDIHCYQGVYNAQPINISKLAMLCELHFSFGSRAEILKTFRTTLWHDEAVRMLIDEGRQRAGASIAVRSLVDIAVKAVDEPPSSGYAMCDVIITDSGIGDHITHSLMNRRPYRTTAKITEEVALAEAQRPLKVRLPALIVERARPSLVNPSYLSDGYWYGHVNQPRATGSMATTDRLEACGKGVYVRLANLDIEPVDISTSLSTPSFTSHGTRAHALHVITNPTSLPSSSESTQSNDVNIHAQVCNILQHAAGLRKDRAMVNIKESTSAASVDASLSPSPASSNTAECAHASLDVPSFGAVSTLSLDASRSPSHTSSGTAGRSCPPLDAPSIHAALTSQASSTSHAHAAPGMPSTGADHAVSTVYLDMSRSSPAASLNTAGHTHSNTGTPFIGAMSTTSLDVLPSPSHAPLGAAGCAYATPGTLSIGAESSSSHARAAPGILSIGSGSTTSCYVTSSRQLRKRHRLEYPPDSNTVRRGKHRCVIDLTIEPGTVSVAPDVIDLTADGE